MPIYLYVKTHNKTGLKYLGTTKQDPYKYVGSGIRWRNHLKKHGIDISTEILCESLDASYIRQQGIYYSQLWNIVDSQEWANLKIEEGDGGFSHINNGDEAHRLRASKAGKIAIKNLLKKCTPWNSVTAKEASLLGNKKLQQLRKENPDYFLIGQASQAAKLSALHTGKGNPNYGKIWCICLDSPDDKSKRIMVTPSNIPEGYLSVSEYKELLKKQSDTGNGKMWIYNPVIEQNKYIDKLDIIPEGWYKGRRMKYCQKTC